MKDLFMVFVNEDREAPTAPRKLTKEERAFSQEHAWWRLNGIKPDEAYNYGYYVPALRDKNSTKRSLMGVFKLEPVTIVNPYFTCLTKDEAYITSRMIDPNSKRFVTNIHFPCLAPEENSNLKGQYPSSLTDSWCQKLMKHTFTKPQGESNICWHIQYDEVNDILYRVTKKGLKQI